MDERWGRRMIIGWHWLAAHHGWMAVGRCQDECPVAKSLAHWRLDGSKDGWTTVVDIGWYEDDAGWMPWLLVAEWMDDGRKVLRWMCRWRVSCKRRLDGGTDRWMNVAGLGWYEDGVGWVPWLPAAEWMNDGRKVVKMDVFSRFRNNNNADMPNLVLI